MGRELGLEPGGMNDCVPEGICGDHFVQWDGPSIVSLEDLLLQAGITKYVRFICGYHIQGTASQRREFCALDWYAQDEKMVESNPNVWQHYVILDQVSWGWLGREGRFGGDGPEGGAHGRGGCWGVAEVAWPGGLGGAVAGVARYAP